MISIHEIQKRQSFITSRIKDLVFEQHQIAAKGCDLGYHEKQRHAQIGREITDLRIEDANLANRMYHLKNLESVRYENPFKGELS